ncbi:hypothetical protein EVAR_62029_1 [Eumeta japonica]|uniref:Uncharacterized protein n=1 Tax=Eumeta variegata TaxID=151549 RepID=A0A4C1ZH75_EUMVA|nr:hypothetical protein EVAR_62029_1 [Eumeta japonica]
MQKLGKAREPRSTGELWVTYEHLCAVCGRVQKLILLFHVKTRELPPNRLINRRSRSRSQCLSHARVFGPGTALMGPSLDIAVFYTDNRLYGKMASLRKARLVPRLRTKTDRNGTASMREAADTTVNVYCLGVTVFASCIFYEIPNRPL